MKNSRLLTTLLVFGLVAIVARVVGYNSALTVRTFLGSVFGVSLVWFVVRDYLRKDRFHPGYSASLAQTLPGNSARAATAASGWSCVTHST
jgi:hypothetical protein